MVAFCLSVDGSGVSFGSGGGCCAAALAQSSAKRMGRKLTLRVVIFFLRSNRRVAGEQPSARLCQSNVASKLSSLFRRTGMKCSGQLRGHPTETGAAVVLYTIAGL